MAGEKKEELKSSRGQSTKGIFSTNLCISTKGSKPDAP